MHPPIKKSIVLPDQIFKNTIVLCSAKKHLYANLFGNENNHVSSFVIVLDPTFCSTFYYIFFSWEWAFFE